MRAWLTAAVLLTGLVATCTAVPAQEKAQQKSSLPPYALIFGSVFDPAGRSYAGAAVEIRRESERKPRWKTQSDARGEFAVRLPAGEARYIVTLRAKGFSEDVRPIAIVNDERIDLLFNLKPATGGKR